MIKDIIKRSKIFQFVISNPVWIMLSNRYYDWNVLDRYNFYYGKSQDYYYKRIACWMRMHNVTHGSVNTIVEKLKRILYNKRADEKKIAFWVEHLTPRVMKIAKTLIEKDYRIELYIPNEMPEANVSVGDMERICGNCKRYRTLEELMFLLICSKAFVVHCFTQWGSCSRVNVLLRQSQLFPKIVVERYDVLTGMYTRDLHKDYDKMIQQEKYAMEHAAGVCFRNYTKEYLERKFHFNYRGKCITFLDYYDKEMESSTDVDYDDRSESLTLCYVGVIQTEKTSPDHRCACILQFADLCKKNKCHFHVYPNSWDEIKYIDYIELEKSNQYFHFHYPIPYKDLGKELRKYDYGVIPSKMSVSAKEINSPHTKEQWIYGTGNKCFDYICFGLPIVANTQEILIREFASKNMLISWDIEQYDFAELRRRRKEMKESVLKNRSFFCIDSRIQELIDFYRTL